MPYRRFGILALVAASTLTAGAALQLQLQAGDSAPVELVVNGTFVDGVQGWSTGRTATDLDVVRADAARGQTAVLTVPSRTKAFVQDAGGTVQDAPAGAEYVASVLVRGAQSRGDAALVVKLSGRDLAPVFQATEVRLSSTGWTRLELPVSVEHAATDLEVRVRGTNLLTGDQVQVDDVSLLAVNEVAVDHAESGPTAPVPTASATPTSSPTPTSRPSPTATTKPSASPTATAPPTSGPSTTPSPSPTVQQSPTAPAGAWSLTNGCSLTTRGIPTCGALLGAGYGSNDDPTAWEQSLGQPLGVRRTYFQASQVDGAVRTVKEDLAAGRVPWISFKAPHSWPDMAAGRGDSWARDLAADLAAVKGPVWLAVHHEPEGEGDITQWTAMQARIAPIIRGIAPNVAYSIVLTGWHQRVGGPAQYSLDSLWPKTTIDLLGVDTYNHYGKGDQDWHTDMVGTYFKPFSAWAKARGIAWGVAETGYTDAAAVDNPQWIRQTFAQLAANGGVGMAYFNSALNSFTNWQLNTRPKAADFAAAVDSSPTLR